MRNFRLIRTSKTGIKYYISKTGRVLSVKYVGRQYKIKELKYIDNCAYYKVKINGQCEFVHRLVAEAYIPNPENKPQVDTIFQSCGPVISSVEINGVQFDNPFE